MADRNSLAESVFFLDAIGLAAIYVAVFLRIDVPYIAWLFELLLIPPLFGATLFPGGVQRIYWLVLLLVAFLGLLFLVGGIL